MTESFLIPFRADWHIPALPPVSSPHRSARLEEEEERQGDDRLKGLEAGITDKSSLFALIHSLKIK
jgi:hypothetical protein